MSNRPRNRLGSLALAAALVLGLNACGKITRENADKIRNGMTEQDLAALLGEPTHVTEAAMPDMTAMTAGGLPGAPAAPQAVKQSVWQNGSKVITVTFVDGKVAAKVTSGL